MNNLFSYFTPKDKKFFPLFEKSGANLVTMSQALVELVNSHPSDTEKRESIYKKIADLEHIGDDITHQIYIELGKNFITPFDREDIHTLGSALDEVADYIHGSASRMDLYNVCEMTEPIKKLADLILLACIEVAKAVIELKNYKNIRVIADACIRINNIENQADYIFDTAVGELFRYEKDAIVIIKYKEVLSAMETATDMCEDVANVLETIMIKNA
jgi:predicted phosphate transport protein (TIGR00153 family)